MTRRSAGILMYRHGERGTELFLVHPGGPFWAKKDLGVWSIPKGEYGDTEEALSAAVREFQEETGVRPHGKFLPLGEIVQRGGKVVSAWAVEGDLDASALTSNEFEMEWPPRSGKKRWFPEVDRGAWFSPAEARTKILPAQEQFITRLIQTLGWA